MQKRQYKTLINEQGQYLHDIDETKQIIWTSREEYMAIFDENHDFGKKMIEGVSAIMNHKGIKFKWVNVHLSTIF